MSLKANVRRLVDTKPLQAVVRFWRQTPKRERVIYLILVAVAILSGAVAVLRGQNRPPTETPVIAHSPDEPAEEKPGENFVWSGRPNDPKYISLPTIDTAGFIENVGIDQHQQIAIPTNIHIAGWFSNSVRPGEEGLSIIDGHVDGRFSAGIFKKLEEIKVRDEFSVEFGDGTLKKFRVIKVAEANAAAAASILFSQDPKTKRQLNLITCSGPFDDQSGRYEKRFIVSAEAIGS